MTPERIIKEFRNNPHGGAQEVKDAICDLALDGLKLGKLLGDLRLRNPGKEIRITLVDKEPK